MHKIHYTHIIIITTLVPIFSALAMENAASNSNSAKSSTDTNSQQVSITSAIKKDRGYLEGALRYATKAIGTNDIKKELIGLRSEEERNNSLQIFKQYSDAIKDVNTKKVDHLIQKQFATRRDYATELSESYLEIFKADEYSEDDIKDASALLQLPHLDLLVPAALVTMLRMLVSKATEKQIENLTNLRNAIKSQEQVQEITNETNENSK